MKPLTVYAPGTRVRLVTPDIADAEVTAVTVRAGPSIVYEVAWWRDGDRLSAWVEASEVGAGSGDRLRIGFRGE